MIKVSVIVPVYNVEDYLEECLDSLVNQTLQEIEIIVVNDGSPDHSQDIIDRFQKQYPQKVRSFIKENGGLSDARNYGLDYVQGEFIGFVDSDDYVDLRMFEEMYETAIAEEADCVVCDYGKVTKKRIARNRKIKGKKDFGANVKEKPEMLFASQSYAWNKLYHRDLFLKTGIRFPVGMAFEDSATIYNVMLNAKKISLASKVLYYYRVNREGAITVKADKTLYDIFKAMDSFINYYKQQGCFELLYDNIENVCIKHIMARMDVAVNCKSRRQRFAFANDAYAYLNKNFPDWHNNRFYARRVERYVGRNGKLNNVYCRDSLWRLKFYYAIPYSKRKKWFTTNKDMADYSSVIYSYRLRELQMIELDILMQIDEICKKHGLRYYLAEGTLLGAVRHNGFIPWDDDMDISMPRDDYEKFLEIAEKEFPETLKICSSKNMPKYHLPFAKAVSTQENHFKNLKDTALGEYDGVFVDIFPIDETRERHGEYQKRQFKKIRAYRDMLLFKCGYKQPKTAEDRWCSLRAKFLTNDMIHKKIYRLSTKDNGKGYAYMVNFASSYPPEKQATAKEAYGEPRMIEFEEKMLPIPQEAEALLYLIYGKFRELPPKNERKGKHQVVDTMDHEFVRNKQKELDREKALREMEQDEQTTTL